jgi:hypothetical protein
MNFGVNRGRGADSEHEFGSARLKAGATKAETGAARTEGRRARFLFSNVYLLVKSKRLTVFSKSVAGAKEHSPSHRPNRLEGEL